MSQPTFTTKEDAELWCVIYNQLWAKVDKLSEKYEKQCLKSKDPKIMALHHLLYIVNNGYHDSLCCGMDKILNSNPDKP